MLFPAQIFAALYTAVIIYLFLDVFEIHIQSTTAVHSLLGIVLGLLLVFRVNSAYDRWWEGRVQWGKLVNDSRSMAMKLREVLSEYPEYKLFFIRQLGLYAETLKEHLKENPDFEKIAFDDEDNRTKYLAKKHKANFILREMYDKVRELKEKEIIDGFQFLDLQTSLNGLVDVVGSCERIKNTPIPYSYSMFLKKFIFLFLSTLPFGFMGEYGYWTIIIVVFLLYILMGTELIAEEIENPFGDDVNDLPTEELANNIRQNVTIILE
jgi:putative membrane protein